MRCFCVQRWSLRHVGKTRRAERPTGHSARSVDVVFIDWEKPRRVLAKGGGREEGAPVSCWRQLLVANEWSELQTQRLTNPSFTLLLLVLVLEGGQFINSAFIHPDSTDLTRYTHIQSSWILRFGITAAWFLILDVGQVWTAAGNVPIPSSLLRKKQLPRDARVSSC